MTQRSQTWRCAALPQREGASHFALHCLFTHLLVCHIVMHRWTLVDVRSLRSFGATLSSGACTLHTRLDLSSR